GPAHRHHERLRRAHHHALDHRLAPDVRATLGGRLGRREVQRRVQTGEEPPHAFAGGGFVSPLVPYFLRKRSTRPCVSTSLYLPVKNGWQFEQISTWNEPRVERVSMTLPQAQVMRHGG